MDDSEDISRMSEYITYEILNALGLPRTQGWHKLVEPLLSRATRQLARIGLTFDYLISELGLPKAAAWSITHWCRDMLVRGIDNLPENGPLLVLSNHPGAYDALVISAQLPRPDLRLIASDLPFIRLLKNFSRRVFFIPINKSKTSERMAGLLSAVRYLREGGAVLLMGSGTIDPDPAVYPGAVNQLQRWTDAISMFLHFVPQTQLVLAAVSHVLSPTWAHHPLTWLRNESMAKRRLAEFGQVLHQLFTPGSLYVSPRVSFAPVLKQADLGEDPLQGVIAAETRLLREHCHTFGGNPD